MQTATLCSLPHKHLKNFLKIYAAIVGLILLIEPMIFFLGEGESLFESFYFAITNIVKSFTMDFEPTLFPSESDSISGLRELIYSVALLSAPICTFVVGAQVLDSHFHLFHKKYKKNYVIFGNTSNARLFVENSPEGTKTDLFTDDTLSKEELVDLSKRNCYVSNFNAKQHQDLLHNADGIFLLEEDSLKNAVIYINYSQCYHAKVLKFYAFCGDEAAVNLIKGYHDEENSNLHSEVQLINIDQIKMDHLFQNYPLISEESLQSKQLDVHVLLLGFDHLCKQAVFHILNDGVLSSSSKIVIEIVYQDEDDKERFLNHFSYQFAQNNFNAYNKQLDGDLEINFYHQTTVSRQFLLDITQDSLLTYTIINQGDVAQNIYAATIVKDFTNSTIALNFSSQNEISRYFQSNTKYFSNFVTVLTDSEVMSTKFICDDSLLYAQKEYNFWYEKLAGIFSGWHCEDTLESAWSKLDYYSKESNCLAYYHKKCKARVVPPDLKQQLNALLGKETLDILLKGDNVALPKQDAALIIANLRKNPELYELLALEHRRWNYFAASQGWKYGEVKIKDLKITPYLVDFDRLCTEFPDIACYDLLGYLTFCNK